jgi:archaellin
MAQAARFGGAVAADADRHLELAQERRIAQEADAHLMALGILGARLGLQQVGRRRVQHQRGHTVQLDVTPEVGSREPVGRQ